MRYVCTQWFHIKCENVSIALYEVLKDQKNKCHWFCSSCEVGAKKLYLQITALTSQQINMNKHIDTIQNQVDGIKRDFENIHTRTNKTEKLVTSMENKTSGQLSEQTKRIQTLETVDRPETNSNAGTHTISERDSSRLQYKIRQEISEIERTSSHENYKVQLPTIAEKKQILAKAKELRDSTHEVHRKVYIRPDMTKRQLEDSKNLHACLQQKRMSYPDKKSKIRKGEVVDLPTEDNIKP